MLPYIYDTRVHTCDKRKQIRRDNKKRVKERKKSGSTMEREQSHTRERISGKTWKNTRLRKCALLIFPREDTAKVHDERKERKMER